MTAAAAAAAAARLIVSGELRCKKNRRFLIVHCGLRSLMTTAPAANLHPRACKRASVVCRSSAVHAALSPLRARMSAATVEQHSPVVDGGHYVDDDRIGVGWAGGHVHGHDREHAGPAGGGAE